MIRALACALPLYLGCEGASADCIDEAADHHGVNSYVLRAIGWHESRLRPDAVNRNRDKSIDVGAFQMNSQHFNKLAKFGIGEQALKNGCIAAYVGAWHYRQLIEIHGNTWKAVGAYHSPTQERQAWYANQIASVLSTWGILPHGFKPYQGVELRSPSQINPSVKGQRTKVAEGSTTIFDAGAPAPTALP